MLTARPGIRAWVRLIMGICCRCVHYWVAPYVSSIAGVAGEYSGDCEAPGMFMKGWSGSGDGSKLLRQFFFIRVDGCGAVADDECSRILPPVTGPATWLWSTSGMNWRNMA